MEERLKKQMEFSLEIDKVKNVFTDWKHRYFGTEVPCPDNDKHQFIEHENPWGACEKAGVCGDLLESAG